MDIKLNQEIMKRILSILVAVALPVFLMAQNSAVDNLFDKYKGKDGVTTVQISPELFQIVKAMEIEEIDEHDIPFEKIVSVKILTIEDEKEWKELISTRRLKGSWM